MLRHTRIATLGMVLGLTAPAAAQVAGTIGGTTMVGGIGGQTVRVVLTATDTVAGCTALVEMPTREGALAARETVTLRAGESGFVAVDIGRLVGGAPRRVELLPAVRVVDGRCAAAVEVHEVAGGRSLAHLAGLLLPASQAAPSAVSASGGQIVRLGAIRGFDPQPDPPACRAVLAFADATGRAVGPSRAIDLAAGGSSFIDLDAGLLLPAAGDPLRTRLVRPQLLLPASGGGDMRGCRLSVQLLDRQTGATNVAVAAR